MAATLKEVLRNTLDNLTGADFKRFKHYLRDQGQIAWGKLEKADTDDNVDLIVQVYSMGAGDVMLSILKKMNHNQLAMDLERDLGRLGGQQSSLGLGGGVNVNAIAHSGGMVNAPAVTGCTIRGPVTFNFGGRHMPQQEGGHGFFKKHKGELEVRLGVLAPLLIDLERNKVLTSLEREEVQSKTTRQEKNYTLMSMLDRKGTTAQDRFYEAVKAHDPLLVEDIEQSAM
ncbi:uncharacterized protein LOC116219384 [Clupea harengus]|uniref:Uncharacterized protein LOC116219384 n=1 Tax=Clupea harengus TaxID=7950 RepID=A0A6P8F3F7_CLUHA|nr:uncharacterized protein LOC116219384 [Clupea harengus]